MCIQGCARPVVLVKIIFVFVFTFEPSASLASLCQLRNTFVDNQAKPNRSTTVMAASTVTSFVDTGEKTNVSKVDKSSSASLVNSRGSQAPACERQPIFLLSADYSRREKYYRPSKSALLLSAGPCPRCMTSAGANRAVFFQQVLSDLLMS